jgi:hypothetical protein
MLICQFVDAKSDILLARENRLSCTIAHPKFDVIISYSCIDHHVSNPIEIRS